MGDTGSLIIGLILAILTINFIELSFDTPPAGFPFKSSPAMAVAILILPLFDTLRVFTIRILNKRSPFRADRNHMHHVLLDMGLNHRETSLTLYLVNIGFILVALALRDLGSLVLLFIISSLAIVLSVLPYFFRYESKRGFLIKTPK